MQPTCYIELDVHKRTISYCVKDGSGVIRGEGTPPATRWPQPQTAAMKQRFLPRGSMITCGRMPLR